MKQSEFDKLVLKIAELVADNNKSTAIKLVEHHREHLSAGEYQFFLNYIEGK